MKKSDRTNEYDLFIQDNFYYTCEVKDAVTLQELDDYEQDERFTPEWAEPQNVIEVNLTRNHGSKNQVMIKREATVLEHLIKEGCFSTP